MSQSATERRARLENNELQPVMPARVHCVRAEGAGISRNFVCIGIFNWNRLLNDLKKNHFAWLMFTGGCLAGMGLCKREPLIAAVADQCGR